MSEDLLQSPSRHIGNLVFASIALTSSACCTGLNADQKLWPLTVTQSTTAASPLTQTLVSQSAFSTNPAQPNHFVWPGFPGFLVLRHGKCPVSAPCRQSHRERRPKHVLPHGRPSPTMVQVPHVFLSKCWSWPRSSSYPQRFEDHGAVPSTREDRIRTESPAKRGSGMGKRSSSPDGSLS